MAKIVYEIELPSLEDIAVYGFFTFITIIIVGVLYYA